jgi:membrane protein YqaA with SNARE-associated domain
VSRAWTRWLIGLFASPVGVVVLAALDSTPFFSFPFGIDAVIVVLAARMRALAWLVPLLATTGSLAGAALTFWMGVKIGEEGLERYLSPRRLKKVRAKIKRSGAIALAALDLIPPPFPFTPFVLGAGALEVKRPTFFVTLAVCRFVRFGAEAALAVVYGSRIIARLDSDLFHDLAFACIAIAAVLTVVSIVGLVQSTRPAKKRPGRPARGSR